MSQLREDEQNMLLHIAREAVRSHLAGERLQDSNLRSGTVSESRAVFVSIHQTGGLRGCIGNIHPLGPLHQTVAECAVSAAVGDPRFAPLTLPELDAVTFEISVLGDLEEVCQLEEIEVGNHGLLVTRQNGRGLLLPQVASNQGWDRERFLSETCRKAGLPIDDWKNGATIQRFTAQVFSEQSSHRPSTQLAPS